MGVEDPVDSKCWCLSWDDCVTASSRLPVLMYGPENIISSAQSLIVDDSPNYLCYNVDKGNVNTI